MGSGRGGTIIPSWTSHPTTRNTDSSFPANSKSPPWDRLEADCATGASSEADYRAAGEYGERFLRDSQCRSADKFKPVYARFVIPDDWNYLVGDGVSGSPKNPLAPSDMDPAIPTPLAALALCAAGTCWGVLRPPAWSRACHRVGANLISLVLLGRRFTLNPVVIFVSLMFWTWLWGVPGALLSVPILVSIKVICDRVPPLSAVSELLTK